MFCIQYLTEVRHCASEELFTLSIGTVNVSDVCLSGGNENIDVFIEVH